MREKDFSFRDVFLLSVSLVVTCSRADGLSVSLFRAAYDIRGYAGRRLEHEHRYRVVICYLGR